MAWLIETFISEGKQGPDHPESLSMKNKDDLREKRINKVVDKARDDAHAEARNDRLEDKQKENMFSNDPEKLNKALDRQKAKCAVNKRDDLLHLSGKDAERSRAIDATERHNRRHPDAQVESVDIEVFD